jgi:hypothetical protein
MLIKIQGPALERLDWDAAAVMFFSKQARRAKVDARYTRGRRSGYKWGNVYGQDDNEPGLEEAVDAKENGDQVDHDRAEGGKTVCQRHQGSHLHRSQPGGCQGG